MSKLMQLFICFLFTAPFSNAQEIYYTPKGTIQLFGSFRDTALNVTSSDVAIILNYQTAEFVLRIEANTLSTGVDSLDRLLDSLEFMTIRYKGRFDLDHIKTEPHIPQSFEVEGTLWVNDNNAGVVHGEGRIEHIADGNYPCLLTLWFEISLDELNYNFQLPFTGREFVVEVNQAILDKEL